MPAPRATPPWILDEVCTFCPSRLFGLGEFDVAARPDPQRWPWNPDRGLRLDAVTGVGVCVHPYDVGLPVGRYGSEGIAPDDAGWAEPRAEGDEDPAAADVRPAAVAHVPEALRRWRPHVRRDRMRRGAGRPSEKSSAQPPEQPEVPRGLVDAVPADADALGGWMADHLNSASPDEFPAVLGRVETAARVRHPDDVVVEALRRALAGG
ncbi:hypothetical protein OG216_16170 [Streptomycetaceae bacterium NBC_01309]